jgi:hypothetical protein
VLAERHRARRRLLEHIEASGRFLWTHGQQAELIEAMRESLRRSLQFRHPGWSTSEDLYRKLAAMTGLPTGAVRAALAETPPTDEQSFTETMRVLEMVRKHL